MHLQKLTDGSIRLSRLNPWDVRTFRSLPSLADYSTDAKAEKRLLPAPAIESDLSPEMAMDWVEYVIPELRESFAGNLAMVMEDLDGLTPEPAGGPEDAADDEALEDLEETGIFADADGDGDVGKDENDVGGIENAAHDPAAPASGNKSSATPSSGPSRRSDNSPDVREKSAPPAVQHFSLTIPPGHAEAWFRAMNQARIVLSTRYGIDSDNVPELSKLLEAGHIEYWFQYELFVRLQGWLVEAVMDPDPG